MYDCNCLVNCDSAAKHIAPCKQTYIQFVALSDENDNVLVDNVNTCIVLDLVRGGTQQAFEYERNK